MNKLLCALRVCFLLRKHAFPDLNKKVQLPQGESVPLELMPDKTGEFEFQCQMGMLRGKLIVE